MAKKIEAEELEVTEEDDDGEAFVTYDIASYPSDLTLGGLADLWKSGDIVIPPFQRKFVWNIKQASLLAEPSVAIMWLIEFAQDLFYRLIVKDIHFRAYITLGQFEHQKLENIEAYYGEALVECYEREKEINCVGVFLDSRLAPLSNIFHLSPFNEHCHFVHVMQQLDQVRTEEDAYPIPGWIVESTTIHFWIAYLFRYLENIQDHMNDTSLPDKVRQKYQKAWEMIGTRHPNLLRILVSSGFDYRQVADFDWTEARRRVGTEDGAWG